MIDPGALAVFVAAALALLLVPGPAVLYIVARSVHQGRAAGLASVLGIHVGTLVHILAATVGLSAIVVSSATAFTVVKLVGAAYLVYLGLRTLLRGDGAVESAPAGPTRGRRRDFAEGIVVNVLNPKTALFFLAFHRSSSIRRLGARRCRSSSSVSSSSSSGSSRTRSGRSLPGPRAAGCEVTAASSGRSGTSRGASTSGSASSRRSRARTVPARSERQPPP
jgi:hypothetical protein